VYDFDGKIAVVVVQCELAPDFVLTAHQDDPDAQTSGSPNRPFNLGFWGVISAHCVYGNGQHGATALLLRDFDYFSALVLAAMRAHPVRQLGLMAVRAFREPGGLQAVVGAARRRALRGVSAFGIRHIFT
jgi:hypothetical protein